MGYIPNDVGLFSSVTKTLLELCIRISTDHYRNFAKDYPETKQEYSGVNCFLNPSDFTHISPNGEVVIDTVLFIAKTYVFCFL